MPSQQLGRLGNTIAPMPNNLLITGESGVGKTTVLAASVELLKPPKMSGFLSPRLSDDGSDPGWRIIGFGGVSGLVAHPSIRGRHRLGLLGVDLELLNECVATESETFETADLVVIDEIGIIGGWSRSFKEFVNNALDSFVPVIAIVRQKKGEYSDQVKLRDDVNMLEVTAANRNTIRRDIIRWVEALEL